MFDSIASSSRTSNNFIWSPTRSSPHASICCFVPLSARKRSPFPLMFCSVRRRKVRKICLTFFRATCVFHSVEFDFSLPLNLAATVSLKLVFIHSKTSKTLIFCFSTCPSVINGRGHLLSTFFSTTNAFVLFTILVLARSTIYGVVCLAFTHSNKALDPVLNTIEADFRTCCSCMKANGRKKEKLGSKRNCSLSLQ